MYLFLIFISVFFSKSALALDTTNNVGTMTIDESIKNGAEVHQEVAGGLLRFQFNLEKFKACKVEKFYVGTLNSRKQIMTLVPTQISRNGYEFLVNYSELKNIKISIDCSEGDYNIYQIPLEETKNQVP